MDIEINQKEYDELLASIRAVHGYDFTDYAESTVKRRLTHFMTKKKIDALGTLNKILLQDDNFFDEFVRELSVTVTEMFRDPTFYKSLREKVVKRLATYPHVKIWIAGCATGEEVYSVAILLKESGLLARSVIYATDINQVSIETAKEGIYAVDRMQAYTKNYQLAGGTGEFSEYYTAKHESVLFDRSLKEKIVFSSHNLAVDKSFNEFQLIICRNVLMYFNRHLQDRVFDLFYNSLCQFGFLGLGDKESLLFSSRINCFQEMDRKEKIYMKIK